MESNTSFKQMQLFAFNQYVINLTKIPINRFFLVYLFVKLINPSSIFCSKTIRFRWLCPDGDKNVGLSFFAIHTSETVWSSVAQNNGVFSVAGKESRYLRIPSKWKLEELSQPSHWTEDWNYWNYKVGLILFFDWIVVVPRLLLFLWTLRKIQRNNDFEANLFALL